MELGFSRAGCPSCRQSNSVKTLKALMNNNSPNDKLTIEGLRERTKHLDVFFFPPITQWCSISDVLFTGGREVSEFSVLKYY